MWNVKCQNTGFEYSTLAVDKKKQFNSFRPAGMNIGASLTFITLEEDIAVDKLMIFFLFFQNNNNNNKKQALHLMQIVS